MTDHAAPITIILNDRAHADAWNCLVNEDAVVTITDSHGAALIAQYVLAGTIWNPQLSQFHFTDDRYPLTVTYRPTNPTAVSSIIWGEGVDL